MLNDFKFFLLQVICMPEMSHSWGRTTALVTGWLMWTNPSVEDNYEIWTKQTIFLKNT